MKWLGVICCIGLISYQAFSQPGWKLEDHREGIRVWSGVVADSKFKALKADCTLEAGAEEVLDLLLDIPAAARWVCHARSCVLLKKVSDTELYYHTEVNLPWPLSNRDFVSHMRVSRDIANGVISVSSPAISGWVSPKPGIVRVNYSRSNWILTPVDKNRTHVEYTLHVDPGGSVPAHIVNLFARRAPVETFKNMRTMLKKGNYRK